MLGLTSCVDRRKGLQRPGDRIEKGTRRGIGRPRRDEDGVSEHMEGVRAERMSDVLTV